MVFVKKRAPAGVGGSTGSLLTGVSGVAAGSGTLQSISPQSSVQSLSLRTWTASHSSSPSSSAQTSSGPGGFPSSYSLGDSENRFLRVYGEGVPPSSPLTGLAAAKMERSDQGEKQGPGQAQPLPSIGDYAESWTLLYTR